MTTAQSVVDTLRAQGNPKTQALYARHGMAADRICGVSTAAMKTIAKSIRGQQDVALALYATGIMEAMYIAGMVASGAKMTPQQLQTWADGAAGMQMIAEYTVPWVTVEHPDARRLASKWIASKHEHVAAAGWCTWSGIVATQPDAALDLAEIEELLTSIPAAINTAKNRVRYTMNGFVISVGGYVPPLLPLAKKIAAQLGAVEVDLGDTACKIPLAGEYIAKMEATGRIGRKKKTIRC
ncbi:MAG TPA: DNA alkylation repair protein [Acidobacteriaceae bacterium]|jgi:3-methyladenine DNA glycosylase AlkD|nr:DNA alkylation repair protein [Acidobacteriaceae bacterium]